MSAATEYVFVEHWEVPGHGPEEVYAVLSQGRLLPQWWKGVYLASVPLDGDKPRVGARTRVKARGFLPYSLSFVLTATALEEGRLVETKADGDFDGVWRAEITRTDEGSRVDITWTTRVNKPLIKWLSPILKPLFKKNHDWTTVQGERGLREYLSAQPSSGRRVT